MTPKKRTKALGTQSRQILKWSKEAIDEISQLFPSYEIPANWSQNMVTEISVSDKQDVTRILKPFKKPAQKLHPDGIKGKLKYWAGKDKFSADVNTFYGKLEEYLKTLVPK